MDTNRLTALAKRIVRTFGNRFPPGVTIEDAEQDAAVLILEWELRQTDEARLFTKVKGILLDRYGKAWRNEYSHPTVALLDPAEEPGGETFEITEDMGAAINALDPRHRRVIQLHLRGKTQGEIAEALGYHQPYVSRLLREAKAKLRDLLSAEGYE